MNSMDGESLKQPHLLDSKYAKLKETNQFGRANQKRAFYRTQAKPSVFGSCVDEQNREPASECLDLRAAPADRGSPGT